MVALLRLTLEEFADRLHRGDGHLPLPEMLEMLEHDPAERIVIDDLSSILRTQGSFREPVTVLRDGEGTEIIGDGRHRTAAHFRTGLGPVEIRIGYANVQESEVLVRVTYEITGAPLDGMPLRSLAVGDAWAVADVCSALSSDVDHHIVSYSYSSPDVPPRAVGEAGVARAAALGFTARVLDTSTESLWD